MERTLALYVEVDAYMLLLHQAGLKDTRFAKIYKSYFASGGRPNGLFGTWLEHEAKAILSK